MTVSLKHTFQSAKPDSSDTALIQPSNWNAEHTLTAAAGKVLGRDTSGAGVVQELPISVDPSGNVAFNGSLGVGTLTPGQKLSVVGTIESTTGGFKFPDGSVQTTASGAGVNYPQNVQSANYTLVLTDAGKQIFHPVADTVVRTYTIPANSSVAFPIGTVVLFTVENGGVAVNVNITTDTLVFGDGTTGTVAVPPNNTLMAIKVTATKWMANYLYQSGIPSSASNIAVSHDTTPFISVYPFVTGTGLGFGTKYADPATLPTGTGNGVAFSPAGNAIAVAHTTSPYITAYAWNISTGFGTKYTNPVTVPTGNGNEVAFSAAGNAIAVAHATTPFISAYPWNVSTGFGTKYTDPATLPAGTGNGVAFSPAGNAIAVAHATTPFISAYPWTVGSGFGTKYTNPATLPASTGNSVAFSPASDAVAVAHATTPFISAYPWNSGTGFGTKYTDPATLPASTGNGVAFSPAGNAIAVAHLTTPRITVYSWSASGFGTKYTDAATLPTGTSGLSVAFSAASNTIAVTNNASPYVSAYPWNASTGFGTKYADPATLPTGNGLGVAFSPTV